MKSLWAQKLLTVFLVLFYCYYPSMHSIFKCLEDLEHVKRVWLNAFGTVGLIKDGGFDKDRLKKGLDALLFLNQQFMPSIGQFITLCFYEKEEDIYDDESGSWAEGIDLQGLDLHHESRTMDSSQELFMFTNQESL